MVSALRLLPKIRRFLGAGARGCFSTSPLPLGEIRHRLEEVIERQRVSCSTAQAVCVEAAGRRRKQFDVRALDEIDDCKNRSAIEDAATMEREAKLLRNRKARRKRLLARLNYKRRKEMLTLIHKT